MFTVRLLLVPLYCFRPCYCSRLAVTLVIAPHPQSLRYLMRFQAAKAHFLRRLPRQRLALNRRRSMNKQMMWRKLTRIRWSRPER